MRRKKIKEYLQGYVRVEVRGKNPERLVNLCLSAGFPIWDFAPSEKDGIIYFCTTLQRYRDIHRLARRSRCVPRVIARHGLPFIAGKVRRRPFALLAAALVLMALIYLSGSVWSIQITGAKEVDPDAIIESAASAGLTRGARLARISIQAIESSILDQNPQIAWVYVRFQGTLAVIEIVEKTRIVPIGPGDVVAARDGVIQSMLVLAGTAQVRIGQTVRAGDVLIAGRRSDTIGARGTITALSWYEAYQEEPLVKEVASRTGRKVELTVLRRGGNEFTIWGRRVDFAWYEIEDYPVLTAFGGTQREVTVVNRVFYEVEWIEKTITPDVAFETLSQRLQASIERQLPSAAKLIDLSYEIEGSGQDVMAVRATACTVEEIGEIRPWQDGDSEVDR